MSYTIVGLFGSQDQAKAVSESLEKKGFKDSDYIVYLTQSKPVEKSFWSKLFTNDIDQEALRVMTLSPPWIPAAKRGIPYKTSYTIPIFFQLGR